MDLTGSFTRNDVLQFLAKSSAYGNLGLFIGAGFSKAVLNDPFQQLALSWDELIGKVCENLGIEYASIEKKGLSYPEIATNVCKLIAEKKSIEYASACKEFKAGIASATMWYPDKTKREKYGPLIEAIDASWIITTNYDQVIESLLSDKCLSLGPDDLLLRPKGIVPIYHLHGIRTNPSSIVITQEDYIALFRPNEYRQVKLALTLKESSTLILGYGIGDVNVLTALDWTRNVYIKSRDNYPHAMIQVLWKENPRKDPYKTENEMVIIEIDSIKDFFSELKSAIEIKKAHDKKELEGIVSVSSIFEDPSDKLIETFIDEKGYREKLIDTISNYEGYLINSFVNFLSRCIDKTWERAKPRGAFEAYNELLTILLDVLIKFDIKKMSPVLFESLAYHLESVSYYVGSESGKSHSANETWKTRKRQMPAETMDELKRYAEQRSSYRLKALLE